MRKFLIAAHGTFSSGMKSSLDIIIGDTNNLFVIDAYTDGNKSIEDNILTVLSHVNEDDELIVFSDLMGGSITNQVLRFGLRPNVHVVSGVNLGLVIDVILSPESSSAADAIETAIVNAREQMVYVNKLINKDNEDA